MGCSNSMNSRKKFPYEGQASVFSEFYPKPLHPLDLNTSFEGDSKNSRHRVSSAPQETLSSRSSICKTSRPSIAVSRAGYYQSNTNSKYNPCSIRNLSCSQEVLPFPSRVHNYQADPNAQTEHITSFSFGNGEKYGEQLRAQIVNEGTEIIIPVTVQQAILLDYSKQLTQFFIDYDQYLKKTCGRLRKLVLSMGLPYIKQSVRYFIENISELSRERNNDKIFERLLSLTETQMRNSLSEFSRKLWENEKILDKRSPQSIKQILNDFYLEGKQYQYIHEHFWNRVIECLKRKFN